MSLVLRQATMADADGIWRVRYSVGENKLRPGRISNEDVRRELEETGRGWVIEVDGSIEAFAIGNARSGNIWALFVAPEAQGRGYGSRLHDVMVDWLREQHAPLLWLTTGEGTKACGFYERRGWKRVGVLSDGQARYELSGLRPPELIDLRRLRLRRPRLSDAPAVFECASDPDVARFADWPISTSIASVEERLRARQHEWESGDEFHWTMTLPPDDRAIGGIACSISGHTAEFGFLLARRFWRNGYATEAACAIVDWIFSVPSIWRLSATCDVENLASARVLEKAGLTREAILRRAIVRPNLSPEPRDAFMYSKVRE